MQPRSTSGSRVADLLFVLALFSLFVIDSALVIIIGARSYTGALERMDAAFESRTALGYIAGKIRQNDVAHSLSLGEIEGRPALCLSQDHNGVVYTTYIYHWDGQLRELLVGPDSRAGVDAGQALIAVADLEMEALDNGLVRLVCTDGQGRRSQLLIAPRTAVGEDGP